MNRNILWTGLFLLGCMGSGPERTLPEKELQKVRALIEGYAEAWVAGDSAAVLALFTEDAVISPSGLEPREGKQALREFWFPEDGSSTEVHSYDIRVLDAGGSGNMAYTYETGSLSFTYRRGDMKVSRSSESFATTLYRKDRTGQWKIFRRMWSDLRLKH